MSPVKYFIDDSLFFELEKDKIKKTNFFIKKSEAELQEDVVQLGQKDGLNFFQVDNIREYDDNYSSDDGYHSAIYIRFDNSYDIYERTTYSLLDWLGDIGGLSEALFFLGALFVSKISEKMMIASILRKIFQLKRHPSRSYRKRLDKSGKRRGKVQPSEIRDRSPFMDKNNYSGKSHGRNRKSIFFGQFEEE